MRATGYILGYSASLKSLSRVIAPTAGGALLGQVGAWASGIVGAVIMGWLISFAHRRLIVNPDPPLPVRSELRWAGAMA